MHKPCIWREIIYSPYSIDLVQCMCRATTATASPSQTVKERERQRRSSPGPSVGKKAGVCSVQSCQHGHITEAGTSAPCLLLQGPSPAAHTPPLSPQADARFSNTYPRVTSLWIAAIIATTSIPTVRLGLSSAFDVQGCQIDTNTATEHGTTHRTTTTCAAWRCDSERLEISLTTTCLR